MLSHYASTILALTVNGNSCNTGRKELQQAGICERLWLLFKIDFSTSNARPEIEPH